MPLASHRNPNPAKEANSIGNAGARVGAMRMGAARSRVHSGDEDADE